MANHLCEACGNTLSQGLIYWHFCCPNCGLEISRLIPAINQTHRIDESEREIGLKPIRQQNFTQLLMWLNKNNLFLNKQKNYPVKLLEVGCAHGWFLEQAQLTYEVLGLEPDRQVAYLTKSKGLPVRQGYFPDALQEQEKGSFNLIVFNDVLEHIPNVINVLEACQEYLTDDGLIVINAPNNKGIFYLTATILYRLRVRSIFSRMWQEGFPSPHLYYFSDKSIKQLAQKAGLELTTQTTLPTLVTKGLFKRINHTNCWPKPINYIIASGIGLISPLLKILPSDITVWLLKKKTC